MTVIRITKQDVLDAVANEPAATLQAGRWIDLDLAEVNDPTSTIRESAPCAVCAVGAVMRAVLAPDQHASAIDTASSTSVRYAALDTCSQDTEVRAHAYLKQGYHMAALSCFFEGRSFENGLHNVDVTRREVLAFVQEHFPETMEVNIGSARVADASRVVKT